MKSHGRLGQGGVSSHESPPRDPCVCVCGRTKVADCLGGVTFTLRLPVNQTSFVRVQRPCEQCREAMATAVTSCM